VGQHAHGRMVLALSIVVHAVQPGWSSCMRIDSGRANASRAGPGLNGAHICQRSNFTTAPLVRPEAFCGALVQRCATIPVSVFDDCSASRATPSILFLACDR
jgi:hypothetical protein